MTAIAAVELLPFIDGIVYGEGSRWRSGRLWLTDGPAGKVYSTGQAGDVALEFEVAPASGLGWLPDGTLVVSTLFDNKIHHVDAEGEMISTFDTSNLAWLTNYLVPAPDGACVWADRVGSLYTTAQIADDIGDLADAIEPAVRELEEAAGLVISPEHERVV